MFLTSVIVELIGIITTATGIGLEIAKGGQVYLIIITVGSCLIAGGGILFGKFVKLNRKG